MARSRIIEQPTGPACREQRQFILNRFNAFNIGSPGKPDDATQRLVSSMIKKTALVTEMAAAIRARVVVALVSWREYTEAEEDDYQPADHRDQ